MRELRNAQITRQDDGQFRASVEYDDGHYYDNFDSFEEATAWLLAHEEGLLNGSEEQTELVADDEDESAAAEEDTSKEGTAHVTVADAEPEVSTESDGATATESSTETEETSEADSQTDEVR